MILTLKELADHLKVNERTILRMLKTGQVKGAKIGGQWRFNSQQIDGLFFPDSPPDPADGPSLPELSNPFAGIPLSRVMSTDRMLFDLKARTGEQVIAELVDPRMLNALIYDIQDLRDKCAARESLLSTGVGNGIAIPHPRDPVPTLRAPGIIVVGRSEPGIDFLAVDGQPVHLFFLLCCQKIELHLHLMGRLAHVLRQEGFVARCMECQTPADMLRLVMEMERREFLNGTR